MFLRIEILAINSALQLIILVLLLATLSSQMKLRHVATSHAAGSSQKLRCADVHGDDVLSCQVVNQASRRVATSLVYGQAIICSNESFASSQKEQEGVGDFLAL